MSGQVLYKENWLQVFVGNERLLSRDDLGIVLATPSQQQVVSEFRTKYDACSIIYVFIDGQFQLLLAIADEIREESKEFVKRSNSQGLSVTMLTGDHKNVAESVCRSLDLDVNTNCMSRLLPEDKLSWVQHQQDVNKKNVIMIGDGINDATALSSKFKIILCHLKQ